MAQHLGPAFDVGAAHANDILIWRRVGIGDVRIDLKRTNDNIFAVIVNRISMMLQTFLFSSRLIYPRPEFSWQANALGCRFRQRDTLLCIV